MVTDNLIPPKTRPDIGNTERNIIFCDKGRCISFTGYELINVPKKHNRKYQYALKNILFNCYWAYQSSKEENTETVVAITTAATVIRLPIAFLLSSRRL